MDQVTVNAQELYDELKFGYFSHGQKREKFDSLLYEFLGKIKKGDKLFDIGCGAGYYMGTYLRHGVLKEQITAVDLAPSNIESIKAKGFNAFVGSVLNLDFKDNLSDFTICEGVLPIVNNPEKAFSELVRITKAGGYIHLNVYNKLHPYFYFMYGLTFPFRYLYWHWNKKIADFIYPFFYPVFYLLGFLAFGESLDERTIRTFYMDQVYPPKNYVHSIWDLKSFAKRYKCELVKYSYNRYFIMLAAIFRINK